MALKAWLLFKLGNLAPGVAFSRGGKWLQMGVWVLCLPLSASYCLLLAGSMYPMSFFIVLLLKFYVMFLSTHMPTISQQKLVQEAMCFKQNWRKHVCLWKRRIIRHLRKMIVSAWKDYNPEGLPRSSHQRAHAGTWVSSRHLRALSLHIWATLSRSKALVCTSSLLNLINNL